MKNPRSFSKFHFGFAAIVLVVSVWLFIGFQSNRERSLIIIKPDGVAKDVTDKVYKRFREELELELVMEKLLAQASIETLTKHYEEHRDRSFFKDLLRFMQSGPIRISVWEGKPGSVMAIRDLVGPTDPSKASPTTIRGQFGTSAQTNVIHASDSNDSARREIEIWFRWIN